MLTALCERRQTDRLKTNYYLHVSEYFKGAAIYKAKYLFRRELEFNAKNLSDTIMDLGIFVRVKL